MENTQIISALLIHFVLNPILALTACFSVCYISQLKQYNIYANAAYEDQLKIIANIFLLFVIFAITLFAIYYFLLFI